MDFVRANVFRIQKSNQRMHLTVSRISDRHGSLQTIVTQQKIHSMDWQTLGTWQRV
jgi:hypothetical protein